MPACGNTRDLFSTGLNNLCGRAFSTRIAHRDAKSQRLLLGRSVLRRRYVVVLMFARKWGGWYRVLR